MLFFNHQRELLYRFFYLVVSFILCFSLCYVNSNMLLTFVTYPYLKVNYYKRLIALNVTEIFYISWSTCLAFTLLIWYPFLIYQLYFFLKSAWFKNQLHDYLVFSLIPWFFFILGFTFCYIFIIPKVCSFFLQWEVIDSSSLLQIELEPRIAFYLEWVLPLCFVSANFIAYSAIIFYSILTLKQKKTILLLLIKSRKVILLILLTLVSFITSDLYSQLFVTMLIYSLYEAILFTCCLF